MAWDPKGLTFGCEIEMELDPRIELSLSTVSRTLLCLCPKDGRWDAASDASLFYGAELRTPWGTVEEWETTVFEDLEAILFAADAVGFGVEETCGVHIHVGAPPGETWDSPEGRTVIAHFIDRFHQEIDRFEEPWEYRKQHTRPWGYWDTRTLLEDAEWLQGYGLLERHQLGYSRYRSVNLFAYPQHGTIEVRWFNGTMEMTWIRRDLRVLAEIFTSVIADLACTTAIQTA